MAGSDHTSRTLLLSQKAPGIILINRGSNSNIDPEAADITTGHSQIKAFNLTNLTSTSDPYDFNTAGLLLGWGLRNDVGIDEEPLTGGIYSVENSADQIERNGVDIHSDNPAEELNFLGYLNGTTSPNQGRNFGYPSCFTAWNTSAIPHFNGTVGTQFGIGTSPSSPSILSPPTQTNLSPPDPSPNDTACSPSLVQTSRLAFPAHTAPLDLLFNALGTTAYITFHGSWNRASPIGYKLSAVAFSNGEPRASLEESHSALVDVVGNSDVSVCASGGARCFRPVGLAWSPRGELWMSSDATGEVFVVLRGDGGRVADVAVGTGEGGGGGGSPTGTTTGSATPSSTNLAAAGVSMGMSGVLAVGFAVLAFVL
jgi:glucose/arabinose dehydrogenase